MTAAGIEEGGRKVEGVPGERWILTSLWKTGRPNSSSRPSGFERPMKHRISVTDEGESGLIRLAGITLLMLLSWNWSRMTCGLLGLTGLVGSNPGLG